MIEPCPYPVGRPIPLEDKLTMVLAPNPSPMTYWGTNTYILGETRLAVIDPGPDDSDHLAALLAVIGDRPVSHILLTHSHIDHSPLSKRLAAATGAPVCAFGTHLAGRSDVMAQLANDGLVGGGEGIDSSFVPDRLIADREAIEGPDWTVTALHTPGHIANHLSFQWNDAVFTGDHVMGWASSLVSPPDGDLTQFMASCDRLRQIPARVYYAGHGRPITNPTERLDWLINHRMGREAQILNALDKGPADAAALTHHLYSDVNPALLPAAQRNVLAHLIDLAQRGRVTAKPQLSATAIFELVN